MFVNPKDAEGVKNIMIFFDGNSALDALIVDLDPKLFYIIWDELDKKYDFVSKHLEGDYFSSDYPRILWQKESVTLSCKKLAPIMFGWSMSKNCSMKTIKTFSIKIMNRTDAKYQKKDGWMIYSPVFDDVLKMICRPLTERQEPSVERNWK